MRFIPMILSCLMLAKVVTSQIPNVYEFCNALLSTDGETAVKNCNRHQCPQGVPGKKGPEGRRGPPGLKGEQGEEGTCDTLEEENSQMRATLSTLLKTNPDIAVATCGLGMKSNVIPDSAITASSQHDSNWAAHHGRLDAPKHVWHARPSAIGQWIQVDLGLPTVVVGVVTQGRPRDANQYIKTFKFACRNDTSAWTFASVDGEDKIFDANFNTQTKVVNVLPSAMTCRFIRLYPQTWLDQICMRMELLGQDCFGAFYSTDKVDDSQMIIID